MVNSSLIGLVGLLALSSCYMGELPSTLPKDDVAESIVSIVTYSSCGSDAAVRWSHTAGLYGYGISIELSTDDDNCTVLYCVDSASDCSSPCSDWDTYSSTISVTDGEDVCINTSIADSSDSNGYTPATGSEESRHFKINSTSPHMGVIDYKAQIQTRGYTDVQFTSTDIAGVNTVSGFMNETSASTIPNPTQGTELLDPTTSDGVDGYDLEVNSSDSPLGYPEITVDSGATYPVTIQVEGYDVDYSWLDYDSNTDLYVFVYDYATGDATDEDNFARQQLPLKVYDFNYFELSGSNQTSTSTGVYTVSESGGETHEGGFIGSGFSHFDLTESGAASGAGYEVGNSASARQHQRVLSSGISTVITIW